MTSQTSCAPRVTCLLTIQKYSWISAAKTTWNAFKGVWLACMEKCSDTWLLKFNPDECKILTVGKLENILIAYPYRMIEVQLEHVFDADLTFDGHVSE